MSPKEQKTPAGGVPARPLNRGFFLSLLGALALTALAYATSQHWERDILRIQLETAASAHVAAIQGEIDRHFDMLHSLERFFTSSEEVTADEYRNFAMGFLGDHRDIHTLGWAPRVAGADRGEFERRARAEVAADFRIHHYQDGRRLDAPEQTEYFPVYFADPAGPPSLRGFDLATHPGIAPLLDEARDNGVAIGSPLLPLLDDTGEQHLALFILPLYEAGQTPETVAARRQALRGYFICLHEPAALVEEALRHVPVTGLDFWVYDTPSADALLHFHASRSRDHETMAKVEPTPPPASDLRFATTIDISTHRWSLLFAPTDAFMAAHYNPWRARSLLIVGVLLSLLCASYVNTLIQRRRLVEARAQELARARQASDQRFRQLAEHIDSVFWIAAPRLAQFFYISPAFEGIFGYEPRRLLENPGLWMEHVHPDDRPRIETALARRAVPKGTYEIEYRIRRDNGEIRWLHTRAFVMADAQEATPRIAGVDVDITERKLAEQALLKAKDAQVIKLSTALEQTADSIMITDRMGVIEYVNPAFLAITGYTREEVLGQTPRLLKSTQHNADFYRNMWATIQRGQVFRDIFVNRRKDGSEYYEEKTISPLTDEEGHITHFVSTGKDITERMRSEEQLHFLAYHDALTGLPNRALLFERLGHALTRQERKAQNRLAVIFIDLDHFKNINDTLGHDMGDLLLQAVPERLMASLRGSDTIARLGGDEFAILCEDIRSSSEVALIADKIIHALGTPFHIREHELCIGASIGISIAPDDGDDARTLIKHADTAMYRAKQDGRYRYQFFSHDMSEQARERLQLESRLRRAIEQQEFHLVYQPQYETHSGRLIGTEALLRWQNDELGPITPERFIPILEETGMIIDIGSWVLKQACAQAADWQRRLGRSPRIAINLSVRQFYDPDLHTVIAAIMQETDIAAELLELEITESVLMLNVKAARDNLRAIKAMGVGLAIDDFGTGYSSLGYLKRFPVDSLKIDRSFIHDVLTNPEDAEIVKAIIAMAHNLNLRVVAEGVENKEQLTFLRSTACDLCQGFLLGRPATATQFEQQFLTAHGA